MSSDSKEGILAVCGTLMGLSSLAVSLRFYVRKKQRAPILTDDVSAVASLITFIASAAVAIHMVRHQIIGHPNSPAIAGEYSAKLQIAWDVLGLTSLACSKLSALFFYRRIFYLGGRQSWFNIVIIITAVVVILWLVVFQFLTGFQCGTHFSALWDGTYLEHCVISFPFLYGLAVSDFLLDVWILPLPIPSVVRLNAKWPKKLAVLGVFLLSILGVFASGNRVAQIVQLVNGGPEYLITYDAERAISLTVFYVTLEAGVSLLAVNLPTLWFLGTLMAPFVRRTFTKPLYFSRIGSGGSNETDTVQALPPIRTSKVRRERTPPRPYPITWSETELNRVEA